MKILKTARARFIISLVIVIVPAKILKDHFQIDLSFYVVIITILLYFILSMIYGLYLRKEQKRLTYRKEDHLEAD